MCSRKTCLISTVVLLVIVGIICLILGFTGFFDFEDPCIDVYDFEVKTVELDAADGNPIMGFLDAVTLGLASTFVPTTAVLTIEMILEVNNTNPYKLRYQQKEEGTILMPADALENDELDYDLQIGTWKVQRGSLKPKASNQIPIEIVAKIDLLSSEAVGMASDFVDGGAMAFRVDGQVDGTGWLPGFTGKISIVCLASVDDVTDPEAGTNVQCKHYTKVGRFVESTGEKNLDAIDIFEDDDYVEPECRI